MNDVPMTPCEEAMQHAREMLSRGLVVGVSCAGDTLGQPTEERVEQLARLILAGDVK